MPNIVKFYKFQRVRDADSERCVRMRFNRIELHTTTANLQRIQRQGSEDPCFPLQPIRQAGNIRRDNVVLSEDLCCLTHLTIATSTT